MNKKIVFGLALIVISCQLNGMAQSEGMKKIRAEAQAKRPPVVTPVQTSAATTVARPRIK